MTRRAEDGFGYRFADGGLNDAHEYLLPAVVRVLECLRAERELKQLFELGCGNGSVAHEVTRKGFNVTGVDSSETGIRLANRGFRGIIFERVGRIPVMAKSMIAVAKGP